MSNAATLPNVSKLDHATLRHLCAWLDHTTDESDRAEATAAVDAGLAYDPEAIERGDTWRDIAARGR
jgi:hypothetical protein